MRTNPDTEDTIFHTFTPILHIIVGVAGGYKRLDSAIHSMRQRFTSASTYVLTTRMILRSQIRGSIAVAFLLSFAWSDLTLAKLKPPVGLAKPTVVFWTELEVCLAFFLAFAILWYPLKRTLVGSHIHRAMAWTSELPMSVRAATLVFTTICLVIFGFWTIADLLGGYNGYQYSFATHPMLSVVYNALDLRAFGSWDVGDEASLFFALALL